MMLPFRASIATSLSKPTAFATLPSGPLPPGTQVIESVTPPDPKTAPHNTQWTPPQWAQATPALTILSVIYPPYTIDDQQLATVQIDYVFDAVFKLIHRRVLRKTSHPVLTGPNITDHAYIEPTRVSLEIGMSDAMAAYREGMWTGGYTKSIAAWQKLKEFQEKKLIITLVTRLDTYFNMMIVEAEAPDDNISKHGLRANIILEEILSATISNFPAVSARGQASNSTSVGTVQAMSPSQILINQHEVPSMAKFPDFNPANIPGAGDISGNNLGISSQTWGRIGKE